MEKSNLLYVIDDGLMTKAIYDNYEEDSYSIYSFLQKEANKYLLDIKGYKKKVKKALGIERYIPIYYSSEEIIYEIKTKENTYLLNYQMLLHISKDDDYCFIFKNGTVLKISLSLKKINSMIRNCEKLILYYNTIK